MDADDQEGIRDLAARLSDLAGAALAEPRWGELAALERELWARLTRSPGAGPAAVSAHLSAGAAAGVHPARGAVLAWRRTLERADLGDPAREVDGLLRSLFERRLAAWRETAPEAGRGQGPGAWFEALAQTTVLEAAALELPSIDGVAAPSLETDRRSLRAGLTAALAEQPATPAQRRHWTDVLVDAADDTLTGVDEMAPELAARRLARQEDDLAWHLERVEGERGGERRRLRRRLRRLRAEAQERRLQARLEGLFGARLSAWWERGILAAILAVLALMVLPLVVALSAAQESWVLLVDAGLCTFFLWDFVFKAALVPGRRDLWIRRHVLTDLVPALPFGLLLVDFDALFGAAPAVGGGGRLAGIGPQEARTVLLVRLLRLPRLARYVRILMPLIRLGRALGFLLRGLDRLVRQHGRLLDHDVLLHPTPAERRRAQTTGEGTRRRLWTLAAEVDRLWERVLAAAPAPRRPGLAVTRTDLLRDVLARSSAPTREATPLQAPPADEVGARVGPCAEDLLSRLSRLGAERIEGELGPESVATLARAVRTTARSPLRWFPFLRAYLPAVPDGASDAEVAAGLTRTVARRLLGHLRRMQWLTDLYGTVTPSELVGRVGATIVKRASRPAVRLLLIGGAYVSLVLALRLVGSGAIDTLLERVNALIGTTLVVLGSLCFLLLAFGFWLERMARDTSARLAQIATAQFLHMTESVKARHIERDARLLTERVFAPERRLAGEGQVAAGDRRAFLAGLRTWLTEGTPVERSGQGFDPVARTVLIYRDVLDGALLGEGDTRATSQLLGNLALEGFRRRSGRVSRSQIKALARLDLERRRRVFGGPYMWFHFITRAVAQQAARLIVEYNENAVPLGELTRAHPRVTERYQAWLGRAEPAAGPDGRDHPTGPDRREPITTAFTALHFLDDAPERDRAIEERFGPRVLERLVRDRRALFRRVFGTYPLHLLPTEERTLNLRQFYRSWVEGGRVLLIPPRLLLLGLRAAGRGAAFLARAIRSIRRPSPLHADGEAESDFAAAARKIDRMRGPAAVAALWQRVLSDVEYLGVPLPGGGGPGLVDSWVQADLDFLDAPEDLRERVAAEYLRATRDMDRLGEQIEAGLFERIGARIGPDFRLDGELRRAAAVAYRADHAGLRERLSAVQILEEVHAEAATSPALPLRLVPQPRLWLAFRRFWREHAQAADRGARLRAWRATAHDVDGAAQALRVLDRLGPERARAEGEALLVEVLRHPARITEAVVTLRAVQTLDLIDLCNYRQHVWKLGRFGESDGEPHLALDFGDPQRA